MKFSDMDFWEKFLILSLVFLIVSSVLTGSGLYQMKEQLDSGEYLRNARVNFSLHPSMPWADIPIFLREEIAMQHPGTLLDRTDLLQIVDFYSKLIAMTYEENAHGKTFSIAGTFDKDGKLVE